MILQSLRLLLEHGADPYLKSSYNKNAWDLSKVSYYSSYILYD